MEEPPVSVLQSVRMDYWQSVLLYQDKPKYGLILGPILTLPVVFMVASIMITPTVAESFVEAADRALGRWAATRPQ